MQDGPVALKGRDIIAARHRHPGGGRCGGCSERAAAEQEVAHTVGLGLKRKHAMALVGRGGGDVPERLGAAEMNEQGLARGEFLEGEARADESHRANLAGDIELAVSNEMQIHSNVAFMQQISVAGIGMQAL